MTNVHTANAQHGLPPLQPIARIAMPTREAFFEDYVWPCRPVVLTDLARQWGDLSRWEPRALAARVHDVRLPVSITRGIYDFARGDDNWVSRDTVTAMSVAELVARMEEGRDECLYLNQQSIPERFPELVPELREPSVMPPGSVQKLYLWVGSKGNVSSLHFDRPNNFLVQLHGRKRLVLFAPQDYARLYPSETISHFSRVDIEKPDLAQFPDYSGAQGYEVVLEAGDTLYLPPFWWHQVYSDSTSVSISVFWHAFNHQLLAPAVLTNLAALYPRLATRYHNYLPGRLPTLIDFARHALTEGHVAAAATAACAALEAGLRENAGDAIEASTELTRNGVAAAVLSRLADDERIGNDAAARAVRWLTLGGAVLAGQVPDAAQVAAMIDDIATLVADELGADSNILTI
jgi:hypothetical protein